MQTVQKRIGLLWAICALAVSIADFLFYVQQTSIVNAFFDLGVFPAFLGAIYLFITAFIDRHIFRVTQVIAVLGMAILGILDHYNSIDGVGLFFLGIALSFKYRFFDKKPVLKLMLFGVSLFLLVEISVNFPGIIDDAEPLPGPMIFGFDAVVFLGVIIASIWLIYKDEINKYLHMVRSAEKKYDEAFSPIDMDKYGITPREEEILRELVTYKYNYEEIAKKLGITRPTVVKHLQNIKNKTGLDTREDLIEMFRNNYRSDFIDYY